MESVLIAPRPTPLEDVQDPATAASGDVLVQEHTLVCTIAASGCPVPPAIGPLE